MNKWLGLGKTERCPSCNGETELAYPYTFGVLARCSECFKQGVVDTERVGADSDNFYWYIAWED